MRRNSVCIARVLSATNYLTEAAGRATAKSVEYIPQCVIETTKPLSTIDARTLLRLRV
jgi:hypothetical protein